MICLFISSLFCFNEACIVCVSLRNPFLRRRPNCVLQIPLLLISLEARGDSLSPPSPIHPPHKLTIRLRHNAHIIIHMEGVEEGPRTFPLLVLDIADLRRNNNLDARPTIDVRFCERDPRGEIEHASNRDGVFEGTGVEVQEARFCVREGGGAGECQLEGLLEEVAAEDHEVVAVAVLGLHDLRRVERCPAHVGDVARLFGGVARVAVGEGFCPHLVEEGGFFGVGGFLRDGGGAHGFFVLVVFFAAGVELAFFFGFELEGGDVDGFLGERVEGDHGESAGHEDVFFFDRFVGMCWRFCYLKAYLHAASSRCVGDLSAHFQVTYLFERILDCDPVNCGSDCRDSFSCMLVCNNAG
jgi:hypothetical protein